MATTTRKQAGKTGKKMAKGPSRPARNMRAEDYMGSIELATMANASPAARSNTRVRLLATALEVFAHNGFEATTMRDLASAVGIKAPAIYNHFKSKESMLSEALLWAMDHFNGEVLSDNENDAPALDRLHGILNRHIIYQLEHPMLAKAFDTLLSSDGDLLTRIGKPESQKELRDRLKHYQRAVTGTIENILENQPDNKINIQYTALAITTMYDSVIRWYVPKPNRPEQELIDAYWNLTLRMLGLEH